MATLDDLKANTTGKLTAGEIQLIAHLLAREVTAPNMVADDDGWHILTGGAGGNEGKMVLLRLIELVADGYERNKIMAQEIRYRDSPPQEGRVRAFGATFEVFPTLGHTYDSYKWPRSYRPLVGELEDEELNPNLFFAYEAVEYDGYWHIKHLPRMPAGIGSVDLDDIDASGGVST